jgi:hypothetical protein
MRLWLLVLPEIRQFPATERDHALRCARGTALDLVELIGMAAALVCVTALTQVALPDPSLSTRTAAGVLSFVVAVPLLVIGLAPFHLRRLRRGLRAQIAQRGAPR